jgi:hypothetical protein
MRNAWLMRGFTCSVILALILPGPILAQRPGELEEAKAKQARPNQPDPEQELRELLVRATMQVFAGTDPVSIAAVRIMAVDDRNARSAELKVSGWDLEIDAPLPLRSAWLQQLQDSTPIPNLRVPIPWHERPPGDRAFIQVQYQAFQNCKLVPPELFKKAGEQNSYVTYDHLKDTPGEYRGKVVPVSGRMIRLRQYPIHRPEAKAQGIDFVYEGWVVGQTPKRNPYCILFVNLPEGLQPQETMDQPVAFYGYFIKKFRYDAQKAVRETNLLIGPTVWLGKAPPPAEQSEPFTRHVVFVVMGIGLAMAAALFGLHWWFRRGDRAVHQQLAVYRDRRGLGLGEDDVTSAVRVAEPHEPEVRGEP